ncbi:hypothetical protein [Streptomyces sp. 7N604]|uniref:hypothetical protein n=1 Tax=Streptomyces sp. 7N604 TaxID=3457415 RepID=UPI003FD35921
MTETLASVYRALAEAEEADAQAETQVIGSRRPARARITGPDSRHRPRADGTPHTAVLDGTGDEVMNDLIRRTEDGTTDVVAELPAQARDGGAK